MVWYSHLLWNFPVHCDPTVKGFGIVNKAEIDVFLELFKISLRAFKKVNIWVGDSGLPAPPPGVLG